VEPSPRRAGAEIIAISSGSVADQSGLVKDRGIEFPVLSDPAGVAIRAYRLEHPGANPLIEAPVSRPAVFLIDSAGTVRERWLTENWRVRMRSEVLLDAIARETARGR
jgi:peroxiredoxin